MNNHIRRKLVMSLDKYNIKALFNLFIAFTLIVITLLLISTNSRAEKPSELTQYHHLNDILEQQRQKHHVPGMAMAIVKNDQVVFAQGFGVSDIDTKAPVTTQTLFGIGSTTKAFTSTLIAMLVDSKQMQWHDPVIKHLPYLTFNKQSNGEKITLLDMVSHQTGFTRFGLLYANDQLPREHILKVATGAEPWVGLREKFLYTNLMVSGAGVAAAKSQNTDWETLLEQKLLQPLNMHNTTARFHKAYGNPLMAKGYMWLKEKQQHKPLTMHDLSNIGPAGAINSNIDDMSQWLRFLLAKGSYNNKRILSQEQLEYTWQPQVEINAQVSYGLGWMIREFNGQKLIIHEGSVEGYSAIIGLFPDANVGFVMLTNLTVTPLLATALNVVSDITFNQETTVENAPALVNTESYVGEYIANFASFKNVIFTVSSDNNTLYVDVPGQRNYELKAPDKDGKMYFAMTDQVSVTFDSNEQGQVSALRMQQNGMNFELPRKGVSIIPEVDENSLKPLLGTYHSELFKGEIKAIIQNHRLALDIPNQMIFELHQPDEFGHRKFRIKDTMSAVFEIADNNTVTGIKIYKHDEVLTVAKKLSNQPDEQTSALPTIAELLKKRKTKKRKKALQKSGGVRLKGTITMAQAGIAGEVVTTFSGNDQFKESVDLGQYGTMITVYNAESGAVSTSFADFYELYGPYLTQMQKFHPAVLIDWESHFDEVRVIKEDKSKDKTVYEVLLKFKKIPDITLYIDAKTGDILKQQTQILNPTFGMMPVTTTYEKYKNVKGLRIAHRVTIHNEFTGKSIIEIKKIQNGLDLSPQSFTLNQPQSGE